MEGAGLTAPPDSSCTWPLTVASAMKMKLTADWTPGATVTTRAAGASQPAGDGGKTVYAPCVRSGMVKLPAASVVALRQMGPQAVTVRPAGRACPRLTVSCPAIE